MVPMKSSLKSIVIRWSLHGVNNVATKVPSPPRNSLNLKHVRKISWDILSVVVCWLRATSHMSQEP